MSNTYSKYKETLSHLLPPVSYRSQGEQLYRSLLIDGLQLDRVELSANRLFSGLNIFSGMLINDWERVCGLNKNRDKPLSERISAVVTKLNEKGSLSIPYIIKKAKELGYDIQIHEPQPFIAGVSRVGDMLWDRDIIWSFFVDVHTVTDNYERFRSSLSKTGDSLMGRFFDPVLETLLDEIKPAHSRCWIRYLGDF
ncbi:YmfQ family protein [Actinobacillus minor]|uniref:YmfQ family protein n=1 Tax=Actinobacillus minor TaxID=51047 RepID=UPI0023EF9941|nr:putative phage tail protein [Actinobacillus minor]MDD6911410.1 DUF2313 domain-containing protein [Actinobacillus minor]